MELAKYIKRFPNVELPYETVCNSSIIPDDYNISLSIPYGKKSYMWFTFENENDVCYLIDINKDKQLTSQHCLYTNRYNDLSIGTILYGTRTIDENTQQPIFIIEDIIMFKGILMNKVIFYNKLAYIKYVIDYMNELKLTHILCMPLIWEFGNPQPDNIGYTPHHIQHRALFQIKPYLNIENIRKIMNRVSENNHIFIHNKINHFIDYSKPQYKMPTIFQCYADIQNDIYHLYAIGKHNLPVYYNVVCIQDYNMSVYMNKVFRKIRENINIDYIEESEDEEDFQNIDIDKYVDTNKMVIIECMFNSHFRKWEPTMNLPTNNKVIHISRLIGPK